MTALEDDVFPAEGPLQRLCQGGHPAPVHAAHPGEMAGEVALGQKAAESLLLKAADGVGVAAEHRLVLPQKAHGQHHAGDTDTGSQALGKGAEIDHRAPAAPHALEAGQRPGIKAELRVVVVLQDVPPRPLPGPPQQLGPPGHRHGDGSGEVVAGGHIAEIRPTCLQALRREAPLVNGHAPAADAAVFQDHPGAVIAGVLHRRRHRSQQPGHKAQQVLHTGAYHDLLHAAVHPPVGPQVLRQLPAQIFVPLAVAVAQELRLPVKEVPLDPPPSAEGEQGRIHAAGGEIKPLAGLLFVLLLLGGVRRRPVGKGRGLHRRETPALQHKKAAARPGLQIPLRRQHLVGGVHRVYRHRQLSRQGPLSRQPVPGLQRPGPNLRHQALIELLVQRLLPAAVQAYRQLYHRAAS